MKTLIFTVAAIFIAGTTQVNAQKLLDRIDGALNKAERAANTADRANNTGNKVMGLFGKKNKNKAKGNVAEGQTVITIEGITLADLKELNQTIQSDKNVESAKMKYNSKASSIIVSHNGSTEDLLKTIQPRSKVILADKNITEMEDGAITVTLE